MKTQTIKLNVIEITYDNGKSEVVTLTSQQIAGLKKSKKRKSILSKRQLASIQIKIKHNNQPL
jgi:hypothetical protein